MVEFGLLRKLAIERAIPKCWEPQRRHRFEICEVISFKFFVGASVAVRCAVSRYSKSLRGRHQLEA